MVVADTEQVEVNSPANNNNNNAVSIGNDVSFPHPSLGRQSSIYSLTLDEFQNTLCDSGKNFGSMNMDEFLNSIWTAEENQNHPQNDSISAAHALAVLNPQQALNPQQPSLSRQGSLSVPAPLCRKTVEEVWSEIQRGHRPIQPGQSSSGPTEPSQQRQQTFGEMTLEDFLVKAGVVREAGLTPLPLPLPPPPPPPPPPAAQFGMYQNGPATVPFMTVPGGYPALPQNGGGESSAYVTAGPAVGSAKRNNGYVPVGPAGGVCYGGAAGIGMASPVSPLGSEGMEVGGLRARKRTLDGPVEKVVERRQRRMIKNRESAARSRARKQAYTVELEAELNQLRDENTQLKQALAELERQRNQEEQQCVEEQQKMAPQGRTHKARDRVMLMRRSTSSPL